MKELNNLQMEELNGGDTMSCINDAYSNHGWLSVALFVETLFIPWTGVAVAGACALKNI